MPNRTLRNDLRGLVLSSSDLEKMTDWPGALIEDYLTILDNLITLAEAIDDSYLSEDVIISGGVVTVTGSAQIRFLTVDTEGEASTDNLTEIQGVATGELIIMQSADASRVVKLIKGLPLRIQATCILNDPADKISLICSSENVCDEYGRSSND